MTKPKRIQRKRTLGWRKPDGVVNVSRSSKWGNPYAVRKERRLRAGLIGTQMLGLALARYVLRLPGVADAPAEVLVARLGNVVQGHLDA